MAHCNPLLFYKNLHFQSRGWGKNKSITYLQAFDGNSIQLKTNATWLLFQAQPQKSVKTLTAIYTLFIHCTVIYPLLVIQYCVSCYIIQISIPGIISQRPKEKKGRNSQEISFKIKLYWFFSKLFAFLTVLLHSSRNNCYLRIHIYKLLWQRTRICPFQLQLLILIKAMFITQNCPEHYWSPRLCCTGIILIV